MGFLVLVWLRAQRITPNISPAKWNFTQKLIKSDRIVIDAVDQQNATKAIHSSQNDESVPPRVQHAVLVHMKPRSGSTFIGDVLYHHKDVMYYMEPLLYKKVRLVIANSANVGVDFYEYLFKCLGEDRSGIYEKAFETYLTEGRKKYFKKLFLSQKQRQFNTTAFYEYCNKMFSHNIIKGMVFSPDKTMPLEDFINKISIPVTVVQLVKGSEGSSSILY